MRGIAAASVLSIFIFLLAPMAAGGSPSWRDDFDDGARIASSSGVILSGGEARLSTGDPQERVGLVLPLGDPGSWDALALAPFAVIREASGYRMWHSGCSGWPCGVGYAESRDGIAWVKRGVVLSGTLPEEGGRISYGDVVRVKGTYWMWYSGYDGATWRIFAASSPDGLAWTKHGVSLDVGSRGGNSSAPDSDSVFRPTVVFSNGLFRMWYSGRETSATGGWTIQTAVSENGMEWTKEGVVLRPGGMGEPDDYRVWAPMVRSVHGLYQMVYSGHDGENERLHLATSPDGRVWTKFGVLVDLAGVGEDYLLNQAALQVTPGGRWMVYYAGRGSNYQVFLTILGPPTNLGWLQSVPVTLPDGLAWSAFRQAAVVPEGTEVRVTVIDSMTGLPVPGLEDRPAGAVDLGGVSADEHPSLTFRAHLRARDGVSPALDAWEVAWAPNPVLPAWVPIVGIGMAAGYFAAAAIAMWPWRGRWKPGVPPPPAR